MTFLALISGANESATSEGAGMRTLATRLAAPGRIVRRYGWKEQGRLEIGLPTNGSRIILIGHSFGGDMAAAMAAEISPQPCDLILIEPVPRGLFAGFWRRWTTNHIDIADSVNRAVCIVGAQGGYPKRKTIMEAASGRRVNMVLPGDHNSVLRADRTQLCICDLVAEWEASA